MWWFRAARGAWCRLITSRLLFGLPAHSWLIFLKLCLYCTFTRSSWSVGGKFDFNISFYQVDTTASLILSIVFIIFAIKLDPTWRSVFLFGSLWVGSRISIRHLLLFHRLAASPTFLTRLFWGALRPDLVALGVTIRLCWALARRLTSSSFIMYRSKVRFIWLVE